MNFVVVNYRGYGASTGSPDPTNLQSDGVSVAKYLQTELGIVNLIAHGESVGGMVACNIARHVDLKGRLSPFVISPIAHASSPLRAHCRSFLHQLGCSFPQNARRLGWHWPSTLWSMEDRLSTELFPLSLPSQDPSAGSRPFDLLSLTTLILSLAP
jgi:surfactin synthase thioesterase subunit